MNIKLTIDKKYEEIEIEVKYKEIDDELNRVINYLKSCQSCEKLIGNRDGNKYVIKVEEIVAIYSNNKKNYIKTKENFEYVIKEKLYELEEILSSKDFMRISNSEIININEIKKLDFSFSGSIKIITNTGHLSYVSRSYLKKFKTYFNI